MIAAAYEVPGPGQLSVSLLSQMLDQPWVGSWKSLPSENVT